MLAHGKYSRSPFFCGSFIEHQRTHSAFQKAKAAAVGSEGKFNTIHLL